MLTAPASPTTKPFSRDCGSLVDGGFSQTQCVTSSSPGGFIASFIEQSKTSSEVRYLTYRQSNSTTFTLVLRSDAKDTGAMSNPTLVKSDLNDDGDPKAVLGLPSTNSDYLQSLDVIDTSGLVVIHLDLNGGFAKASTGGGLDAWFPATKGGYEHDIIRYLNGKWTVISQDPESETQAQPNHAGGFTS